MGSTDLQLLARYADARDAEAFAELVARHRDMVYAACYRVLANRADAEDATQECFLRLASHAGSIKRSVAGWLHRVAVHTSVSVQRRDRSRKKTEWKAATTLIEGPQEASWDKIKAEIDRAIDRLPDRLREPLVLHFLEGRPQTAIGEELGVSQSSVSRWIKEGVEKVRRHLAKAGFAVSTAGLAGVLKVRVAEAAPPALVAELGKIGLAGIGSSSSGASAGSALGLGLITGANAKIACVAATALTVAAIVQYAAQEHAVPCQSRTTLQSATTHHIPIAAPEKHVPATPTPDAEDRTAAPRATAPAEDPLSAHMAPRDHGKRVAVRPSPRNLGTKPKPLSPEPEMSLASTERSSAHVAQGAEGASPEAAAGQNAVAESPAVDATAALAASAWQSLRFFFAQPRQPPGAAESHALERPGVSLSYEEGVDEALCSAIADVVAVAKGALDGLFPERRRAKIHVVVSRGAAFCEYTMSERRGTTYVPTIYVQTGKWGLGEWRRPDAGPIGLLCEAVAEVHNPQRLAGFDRFIAHRYLVPAVVDQMGPDAIVRSRPPSLAEDGPSTLAAMAGPEYASVHPDYAAVAALMAIEDELQFDGLRALLDAVPEGADDAFAALREAAIERVPALADAFTLYDEANELWLEDDGSCLVASFEPGEVIEKVETHRLRSFVENLLVVCPGFEVSPSDKWSTHGTHSLKAEAARPSQRMVVYASDPDWKLKDWRRFSKFELDLMLEGAADRRIAVSVQDHVAGAHGSILVFSGIVLPGQSRHISYPLTTASLRGKAYWNANYFSGRFRADEVSRLLIDVRGPAEPFRLYIDNIRLTPRGAEKPGVPENVEPDQPAPDDGADNAAFRRMEHQAQAAADVEAALGEKRERNMEAAEELLRRAIERDETHVEAHRVLAWTLVELGREAEAAAEFQRVIDLAADEQVRKEAEEALQRLR